MMVFVYSAIAAEKFGYNIVKLSNCEKAHYTGMYDEDKDNWRDSYLWNDAKEVAKDDVYEIVYYGTKAGRFLDFLDCNYPYHPSKDFDKTINFKGIINER